MMLSVLFACTGSTDTYDTSAPAACEAPAEATLIAVDPLEPIAGCESAPSGQDFGTADLLVYETEEDLATALACGDDVTTDVDWSSERVVYLHLDWENPDLSLGWIEEAASSVVITVDTPNYCGGANPQSAVFEAALRLPAGPLPVEVGRCNRSVDCGTDTTLPP